VLELSIEAVDLGQADAGQPARWMACIPAGRIACLNRGNRPRRGGGRRRRTKNRGQRYMGRSHRAGTIKRKVFDVLSERLYSVEMSVGMLRSKHRADRATALRSALPFQPCRCVVRLIAENEQSILRWD